MLSGSACPWAKLTEDQVTQIRCLYATGNTDLRKLGKEFGVSHATLMELGGNPSSRLLPNRSRSLSIDESFLNRLADEGDLG